MKKEQTVDQRERNAELVRALMHSPVWNEVIIPLVEYRIGQCIRQVKDRSDARKANVSDDYLAGRWEEAELWLTGIMKTLQEWESEKARNYDDADYATTLRMRAVLGLHSPVTSAPAYPSEGV
jgi:hypothetical protein